MALLSFSSGNAWAQQSTTTPTTTPTRAKWAGPLELIVEDKAASFDISVHKNNAAFVRVPRGIKRWKLAESSGFQLTEFAEDSVYVFALNAKPGTEAGLRLWSDGFQANLRLKRVETLTGIDDTFVVKTAEDKRRELSEQAASRPFVEVATKGIESTVDDQLRDSSQPARDPTTVLADDRLVLYRPPKLRAEFDIVRLNNQAMAVTVDDCEWLEGRHLLMTFTAKNMAHQPFPWVGLHVSDRNGSEITSQVRIPGKPEDTDEQRPIYTFAIGETIGGGILIKDAIERDLQDFHLEFYGLLGTESAITAGRVTKFRPVPDGDLELERQDREARGRVTIQVQPMYGVMWLANPLDINETDSTSMRGVGIRASYGINRWFAFAGELVGGSSGDARFSGMTYQGVEGDLARRSSFGRLQIGTLVRLGYKFAPTLRLGLGFQGADNGTRFVPAGGDEMSGPDSGFEADFYLSFGTGIEIRLGKHWNAGLGVAFSRPFDGSSLSLEGGLHIGYGWTPGGVIEVKPFGAI